MGKGIDTGPTLTYQKSVLYKNWKWIQTFNSCIIPTVCSNTLILFLLQRPRSYMEIKTKYIKVIFISNTHERDLMRTSQ